MAPDRLTPVRMKSADMGRADVQAFRCGSKPHELPLAEWIKVHSAERIDCGNKVWLYERESENGQKQLVGYGSLATGNIETFEADNSKKLVKGFEIPMLALHEDFWGCPKGVTDPEEKYSRQIVRHLQQEARAALSRGRREPLLALYVHPDAEQAQKLYLDCGFVIAPGRFLLDFDTDTFLLGMDFVLR